MEIRLQRTFDPAPVNWIINHPAIFRLIRIDGVESFDDSESVRDERNFNLLAYVGDALAGVVGFDGEGEDTYDIHPNILPRFWGRGISTAVIVQAMAHMFDVVGARRIVASIPDNARCIHARRMAQRVGMRVIGILPGFASIDGVPVDYLQMAVGPDGFRRLA